MAKHPNLRAVKILTLLLGVAGHSFGADFTWTGAADGNWDTGLNWSGGVPVSAADTAVIFDSTAQPTTVNNIPGGLTLNSLVFTVTSGSRSVSGNTLIFDGVAPAIVNSATAGNVAISAPISLLQTVTVSGGPSFDAQLLFDGAFSGTGGLTFTGGVTTLRAASSYTGATIIENSSVVGVLGSNALGSTSGVTVGPGAQLQLIRTGTATATNINKSLTLAGSLTSQSKKINVLGAPAAGTIYSGSITLSGSAGIRAFGATGTGFDAAELLITGPINRAGNDLVVSTAGLNNTVTISGTISGAGGLELTPDGGAVALAAVTGNGDVLFSGTGGTASLGSLAGDGNLVVQSATPFGSVSISGAVTGNRNIQITSGALTLSSTASTFTGGIEISGNSTLHIADQARLGNAANTLTMSDGGLLNLTSSGNFARAIAITSGPASIEVNGFSRTISSNISGAGGLQLRNFSTQAIVTLSGSNSFQDGLTIGSGIIVTYSNDSNLGAAGGDLILNGGSLSLPGAIPTFTRAIEVTGTGGNLSGAGGATYELAGDISGAGRLNLAGNSTFTITGSNTAAGGITLAGNVGAPTTLEVGSDAQLGGPSGVLNIGRQNGLNVLPGRLRATADLSIAATRTTTFRDMTVDTNGHTVTFNQAISGRGMTKTGDGVWILNTANTDNSNVNSVSIEQGTLRLGINDALGAQATITGIGENSTLDLNGFNLEVGSVNSTLATSTILLGSGTLTLRGGGNIASAISGSGALVLGKTGFSGQTTILSGSNAFSGGLTIHEGSALYVQNSHALGAPGNAITINNGSLAAGASLTAPLVITNSTNLTIGSGGAAFQADGQSIIIESVLSGSNPLKFLGGSPPGTDPKYDVRLMNTSNSFTGNIQLGDAQNFGSSPVIIGIAGNGSLGNAGNIVTLGNSHFDGETMRVSQGGLRAYADVVLPATRVLRLDGSSSETSGSGGIIDTNGHTVTIEGAIIELAAGMPLLKTGLGTLLLQGDNTYTGLTTVAEGALGGTGSLQSITVGSSGTLAPGASAGLLTVNDGVDFLGGTLAMELGGTTRGLEYDALDIGGALSLGGANLSLTFINGFESSISASDTFLLADAASLSGDFGNVLSGDRLATTDGLGSFLVTYDGTSLMLSDYAAVPEPRTLAMAVAGLLALAVRSRRANGAK